MGVRTPRNDFERMEGHLIGAVKKNMKSDWRGKIALDTLVDLYRNEIEKLNKMVRKAIENR